MSYAVKLEEHRRLVILRVLAETPGYASNTSLLADAVESLGVPSSRAQVSTAVSWLSEQGLVSTRDVGGVGIAQLRDPGLDVALGRSQIPGVKRPSPGGD